MALRPVAFSAQPTQTELRLSKAAVVKTMPCIPMISHWIRAQVNQTANHFIQRDFFCLEEYCAAFKKFNSIFCFRKCFHETITAEQKHNARSIEVLTLQHSKQQYNFWKPFSGKSHQSGRSWNKKPTSIWCQQITPLGSFGFWKKPLPNHSTNCAQAHQSIGFQRDGKIDIILSPKDLAKVEFNFQSHAKSALSIVLLTERDATAALVRRHMDVLTKQFERLRYPDFDFSCDDQSKRQKWKGRPTKERENIDNTIPQLLKAQSESVGTYGYSLFNAIDISLWGLNYGYCMKPSVRFWNFCQILTTQLRHQDPMDSVSFTGQLLAFSSIEQHFLSISHLIKSKSIWNLLTNCHL